ncbi:MAG: ABC transporter ATP-binding protein, partial [Actinomycetota bacterium]
MSTTASGSTPGFSWRRVAGLFAPHRGAVGLLLVLVLATSILGVVNPLLIQVTFDDALFPPGGEPDLRLLVVLSVIMLAVTVLVGGLGVAQTQVGNRLGQRVLRDLRDRVYRHLQDLSLSFYASARTGDLQSRISNDVGGVQAAVTSTLSSILANVVTLLAAVVAMAVLSWPLALLAAATVPIFVVATRFVGARRKRYTSEAQAAIAEMNVLTQETLSVSGFTLSRLFGQQSREIDRFTATNQRIAEVATRQQVIGQAFFTVVSAFMGASPIVVYL